MPPYSTMRNAMPYAVMPSAATAIGNRICNAACAPLSRSCQVSKSRACQLRNNSPLSSASVASFVCPTRDRMSCSEDEAADDDEQIIRDPAAGEAPHRQREPSGKSDQKHTDAWMQRTRHRPLRVVVEIVVVKACFHAPSIRAPEATHRLTRRPGFAFRAH